MPADLRGGDIEVVLHGARFATSEQQRELIVRLDNGRAEISRTSFDAPDPRDIRMTISADIVDAGDGRIVLFFETPNALPGADFGRAVSSTLGFFLQHFTITAAT